ncbi:MAG: twin-arginine translocase TatA/TatE family subunit [Candidatus Contendobacter sp.]
MHFSIWELLIVLVIVLVLFGGNRLRNLGSDLGTAIRGFRDSMKEGAKPEIVEENPQRIEQIAAPDAVDDRVVSVQEPLARPREKV